MPFKVGWKKYLRLELEDPISHITADIIISQGYLLVLLLFALMSLIRLFISEIINCGSEILM